MLIVTCKEHVYLLLQVLPVINIFMKMLPGRSFEVKQLKTLLGNPADWAPPFTFLYGHSSCGKSAVLTHVLETQKHNHGVVNCVECYSTPLLFNQVLQQFSNEELRCENMNDFVKSIKDLFVDSDQATYIVFDKAESLRDREPHLLPALATLQELTELNLGIVFVSELPWDRFQCGVGARDPLVVFFPEYTKEELSSILRLLSPPGVDEELYGDYIAIVLHVFASACNDLRELRHLAELNFPLYCRPIESGEASKEDKRRLWRNIQPHLQKAQQELYLRHVASNDWVNLRTNPGDSPRPRSPLELPFFSKFLLISAYLASFNPASSDRRFFLKNAGRMRRSARSLRRDERKNLHLRGPRAFPLDRMMAIFYTIVDERVPPTASLFAQVTSLLSLHLLVKVSRDDVIDSPRYKCAVSLPFVSDVAKSVAFDVTRYLYDFI